MKRVWKPLDVANLRLYEVRVEVFRDGKMLGVNARDKFCLVLASSPSHAARLVHRIYSRAGKEAGVRYETYGKAVNVLMPESWWENGVPCIHNLEVTDGTKRSEGKDKNNSLQEQQGRCN